MTENANSATTEDRLRVNFSDVQAAALWREASLEDKHTAETYGDDRPGMTSRELDNDIDLADWLAVGGVTSEERRRLFRCVYQIAGNCPSAVDECLSPDFDEAAYVAEARKRLGLDEARPRCVAGAAA